MNTAKPDEPRSYDHASAGRANQPTAETAPLMTDSDREPAPFRVTRRMTETVTAAYEAAVERADVNLDRDLCTHPLLAWDRRGPTSRLDGDLDTDASHDFAGAPLYTREKVTPALLVEQLRRSNGGSKRQLDLDFDGLPDDAAEWEWYQHSGHWQNRLVHGDSSAVMQSLIAKDGLRGQVQMIYFDPPYGQGFKSNFQTEVARLETPENLTGVPAGDSAPLRAFRDSYRNGIHSYLDGIHERAALARELLTESGSLFVQIGDKNVHRLALVLDEVFGPENRIATITWRPTGSSSARTLPETASYLLWYAKSKDICKFNQIYEQLSRPELIDSFSWHARIELRDGSSRKLTTSELDDPDQSLPKGAKLFRRVPLNSAGSSTTGRTREIYYGGNSYHCGAGRHWCVSVHDGDAPVCAPQPDDNGARTAAKPPCPDPKPCGLCWLGWTGRIDDSGQTLQWKWYESEVPGRRLDNVWQRVAKPTTTSKRYVVQTSDAIIERCLLMTTDPGDLVLDPTCGSGVTANVAEEWGRRWITIDVSRVAIAVARQHLATSTYPWHRVTDGGNDPAAGFVCKTMRKVSAGRLADPDTDWEHPDNVIRLVDQTERERRRIRLCSPFTVESHSPFSYLPFDASTPGRGAEGDTVGGTGQAADPGLAAADTEQAVVEALHRSPICDSAGRTVLEVIDHEPWPEARLATHGVTCTRPGRDTQINAALMIAASDATVTPDLVRRAATEARQNASDCRDLIVVGFAFEPEVPARVGPCAVHRVVGSKDLQIPELSKNPDGGTFTLLGEPDCEVRRTSDGTGLVVRLYGCDTYDPSTGAVRETKTDDIDCWMIDTDHDSMSFIARLTYFPNGVRNKAGLRAAMKSLAKDLDPAAEANLTSLLSQPFDIPADGRPVAVKAITSTGAEMNAVIHPDAWLTPTDHPD